MKIKLVAALAIALMIAAGAIAVLAAGGGGGDGGFKPVTVVDQMGREVTIGSAERIVSVSVNPTAIVCGLGASSSLVAVSSDSDVYFEEPHIVGLTQDDFPQAVRDGMSGGRIKALGQMYNMSAETIVSVESDLVIMSTFGISADTRATLDSLGVTYIVTASPNSMEDLYGSITLIGKSIGKEAEADRLVSEMKGVAGKISAWCKSIVDDRRGGDRYDVALMMNTSYAVGPNYISGAILRDLHANNVFDDLGRYAQVSKESIARADPEIIIYQDIETTGGITDQRAYVSGLASDPVLGGIRAAEDGRAYATIHGAKNATAYYNQGIVRAYAMWAMFIYQDYLPFEFPHVLDSGDYTGYIAKFWDAIGA